MDLYKHSLYSKTEHEARRAENFECIAESQDEHRLAFVQATACIGFAKQARRHKTLCAISSTKIIMRRDLFLFPFRKNLRLISTECGQILSLACFCGGDAPMFAVA